MSESILLATPTTAHKSYVIEEFAERVNALTHPQLHYYILDNGGDPEYHRRLLVLFKNTAVVRKLDKPADMHPIRWMYHVREDIREYFLNHTKCNFMLMLDSDTLITQELFDEMLSHMRNGCHWCGPVCAFGYANEGDAEEGKLEPMVLRTGKVFCSPEKGGLDNYSWDELGREPDTFSCHAVSLGCCMVSRYIMNDVPFPVNNPFPFGEDLIWFNNASERGYKALCINREVEHKTHNWDFAKDPTGWDFMKVEAIVRSGDKICQNVDISKERKRKAGKRSGKSKTSKKT